jgi:hypothetical protein
MINGSELQAALKDSGMDVNFLTLKAMMYRADQDGNGELSKQEWLDMVHGLTTKEAMAVDHYVKAEVERKAREEEEAKKKK